MCIIISALFDIIVPFFFVFAPQMKIRSAALGMGGCIPPTFLGGGWPVQISPPPPHFLKIYKITLNLTFYCKEIEIFNCKTIKNSKIAGSLRSLAHKCILKLDHCGFASTCTPGEGGGGGGAAEAAKPIPIYL